MRGFICRAVAGLLLLSAGGSAQGQVFPAGKFDLFTKFPILVGVDGGPMLEGIYDTGGVTSLSFADAQRIGILGADGRPTPGYTPLGDPAGLPITGAGGGQVLANAFAVNLNVQGAAPREQGGIEPAGPVGAAGQVPVFVPVRPDDQPGSTPEERERQTESIPTLLGANLAAFDFAGQRIKILDARSDNPLRNLRATVLASVDTRDPFIPFQGSPVPTVAGAAVNGTSVTANVTLLPTTLISPTLAEALGIVPLGFTTLDPLVERALFAKGFIDALPGAAPLSRPFGVANFALPSSGGVIQVSSAYTLIVAGGAELVIGGNVLVPEGYTAYVSEQGLHLSAVPEPAPVILTGAGIASLAVVATRRSRTTAARAT
jgi:hypothetical protein